MLSKDCVLVSVMKKLERLKVIIQGKERWKGLESYVLSIDENKDTNPNIALDNAKSILESVCKTILEDKGLPYNSETVQSLLKKTFESLSVFSKLKEIDVNRCKSIIGSLQNIGEFRNDYGFFSHGQDLEAEKFDRYLVDLAISSSDLLISFLIISHSEDLKDRFRIYYDENPEFNKWFDEREEWVEVKGIPYSPSKTLFSNDIEAYKEEMITFENDPEALIGALENANDPEIIVTDLIKLKPVFSEDNFKALAQFVAEQEKISNDLRNKIIHSGLLDAIEHIQNIVKPQIEAVTKIQKVAQNIVKAIPVYPKKKD